MTDIVHSRGGRPVGRTGQKALDARRWARSIVESTWYQASIVARLKANQLPPAIEALLLQYAFGSPKHIIDMTIEARQDMRGLSREELEAKAEQIVHDLRAMREQERAQKSLSSSTPDPDAPPDAIDVDAVDIEQDATEPDAIDAEVDDQDPIN